MTFTTRGSSVLAAALAAGLGSFALGETDLLRVAIVIVVVCLATWLVALALRVRVRSSFHVEPPEAPVGASVRIHAHARIRRPMMPGSAVCHALTDVHLADTGHLAVPGEQLRRGARLDFTTVVRARGVRTVGPLAVSLWDPLGLVTTRHVGGARTSVLGLPRRYRVHPDWLRSVGVLPGASDSSGEDGLAGEPDVGVREHRPEDGLRRIHWRTTARTGRLMTRQDHPESIRAATIAFDTRAVAHDPDTFERTLEVVASLGAALLRQGWDVRLIDSTGERRAPAGGWREPSLLRMLAIAQQLDGGVAPPLPADRTPALLVTTDATEHRPRLVAQTILIARSGAKLTPTTRVATLPDGASVAALLGAAPRLEDQA